MNLETHKSAAPERSNPASPITLNVFEFLDYRAYLKAFYEAAKRAMKGRFSYRLFSNKTGVDSPNYLKLIVDGQRNLTPAHAKRVAKFCRLNDVETKFFLTLVKWNQSKQADEAVKLWNDVITLRMKSGFRPLSASQIAVISDLRLVALFELLQISNRDASPEGLGRRLSPAMDETEVKRGLATLESAGFIRTTGGRIRAVTQTLKSEDDVPSKVVRQYHAQAMASAANALLSVPVERREFISTTVALPVAAMPDVKALLREMRDKLLAMSESAADANAVFQINFQFFPLTNLDPEKP